jgi:hypothetical protein
MQLVLEALRDASGAIVGETFGDARLVFADDIAAMLVLLGHGGGLTPTKELEPLGRVHLEIEKGIAAFVEFVNDALSRYLQLAIDRGAEWKSVPDPPS